MKIMISINTDSTMKKIIFSACFVFSLSAFGNESSNVLATKEGRYVLGSVETGGGGVNTKKLYLLDTANGQVWHQGCITWDKDDKCTSTGLRPVGLSDGAGGRVFDNAEAWSYANDLGKVIRESERNGQKTNPLKK